MDGGVAEFAYRIAKFLQERGRLDFVLSIVPQTDGDDELPIVAHRTPTGGWRNAGEMGGDRFKWFAKFNTLRFHWGIDKSFRRGLREISKAPPETAILLTFTNSPYARRLLRFCRKTETPYILLFHGQDIIRMVEDGRRNWLLETMVGAQQVLFNSSATRALAEALIGSIPSPTHVLYPGIDFSAVDRIQQAIPASLKHIECAEDTLRMSSVCRLVHRKGLHLAIQALIRLQRERPEIDWHYFIGGRGPELETLQALAGELSGQRIHFLGYLTDAEKWGLLQRSELFLMPNMALDGTDFEGFGISFIEASYMRNWVIGGQHGGAVEAIESGVTGASLDADATDASDRLCEQIADYAAEREYFRGLATQAPQTVRERFDFQHLGQAWLDSLKR